MNADMASTNYDSDVRQLSNIADIYGLHQLISEPTRITDKQIIYSDRFNLCKLCWEDLSTYDQY